MPERSAIHRKLNQFIALNADENDILSDLVRHPTDLKAGTELAREGEAQNACLILLEGWGFCYKHLPDGGRQIINIAIAGDFMGARNRLFAVADHSFSTLTRAVVATVPFKRFQEIVEDTPRLGQAFLWSTARDEAILVEHLVNLGRRSAIERIAHLLLELADRMAFLGLGNQETFNCPLTQDDLADCLGLTSVHVNRVLRELREKQLVTLSGKSLRIHDLNALRRIAMYDDEYLDHLHEPEYEP